MNSSEESSVTWLMNNNIKQFAVQDFWNESAQRAPLFPLLIRGLQIQLTRENALLYAQAASLHSLIWGLQKCAVTDGGKRPDDSYEGGSPFSIEVSHTATGTLTRKSSTGTSYRGRQPPSDGVSDSNEATESTTETEPQPPYGRSLHFAFFNQCVSVTKPPWVATGTRYAHLTA